ncbi:Ig-like domain-containing protein [Pseudescherichia sp.]|uniref:Ig-like domain-containing protein n=1 Tax=Pseudescherichia sp. TaxID=2055881 RepID=UPI002898C4EE|nr:Ig-like domain-containing protein [Pseudescherichia sp.]
MTPSLTDVQDSSLAFYSLPNYAGDTLRVVHGQTGLVASSGSLWAEQSVSVPGTDNLYTFLWSSVDIGNPAFSYTGHVEHYITTSIPNIASSLSMPQYPLQFLGVDAALAVPVFVQLSGEFSSQNCFASSSLVPGSSTKVSTFASFANEGALAFIQNINGASTLASLTFGTLNEASGTVMWSASGSVILVYNNDTLTLASVSGLPTGWSFGPPLRQDDGSWLVILSVASLPATAEIGSLTSDKTSIENNGTDIATFSATVIDSASEQALANVSVDWNTTLGNLSVRTSLTNNSGIATVTLTDTGDIGTATVMARISNGSAKSQAINLVVSSSNALLYSETNYQGELFELQEHASVQMRTALRQWLWKSARVGVKRLFSRTVIQDVNNFNFLGYADNVSANDVADITTLYDSKTSPWVEATALGSNDIVIRSTLLSSDLTSTLVACAEQHWPATMTTASLTIAGKSNSGIIAVMDKTQAKIAIPLLIGELNSAGNADWIGGTSLIVTWDEVNQMPVVMLAGGDSQDFLLGSVTTTATSGEYAVSLFVKNNRSSISSVVSDKPVLIVNGSDRALITATVVDGHQSPLKNTPVFWTATSGKLSSQSSVTNAQGEASTLLMATQEGIITVTATLENSNSKSVTVNAIAGPSVFPQFIATNIKKGTRAGTISFELIAHNYPGAQNYVFRFYTQPLSGNNPGAPTTTLYLTDTSSVHLYDTAYSVTNSYIQQNASTYISGSDWKATLHIIINNLNLATSDWEGGTINLTIANGSSTFTSAPSIYIPAM